MAHHEVNRVASRIGVAARCRDSDVQGEGRRQWRGAPKGIVVGVDGGMEGGSLEARIRRRCEREVSQDFHNFTGRTQREEMIRFVTH